MCDCISIALRVRTDTKVNDDSKEYNDDTLNPKHINAHSCNDKNELTNTDEEQMCACCIYNDADADADVDILYPTIHGNWLSAAGEQKIDNSFDITCNCNCNCNNTKYEQARDMNEEIDYHDDCLSLDHASTINVDYDDDDNRDIVHDHEENEGESDVGEDICSEDDDWCHDESYNTELFLFTKPIIVGYAFGPKKMSTMGVVMAEASKTRLSATHGTSITTTSTSPLADDVRPREFDISFPLPSLPNQPDTEYEIETTSALNTSVDDHLQPFTNSIASDDSREQSNCCTHDIPSHRRQDIKLVQTVNYNDRCDDYRKEQQQSKRQSKRSSHRPLLDECVTFTIDGRMVNHSTPSHEANSINANSTKNTTFRNIVRRFRSSCSSIGSATDDASSTATGTCTASIASSSQFTTGTTSALASTSSSTRRTLPFSKDKHIPVRVSFVPLDPDSPLDEQHGGKLDVILHKLTEDILFLSQLSSKDAGLKKNIQEKTFDSVDLDKLNLNNADEKAVQRVLRVSNFRTRFPECCVVDDPGRVMTLMSRADIARTLQQCLRGVTSKSGIPVNSPKFSVVDEPVTSFEDISSQQHLSYPIIAKPLCAAGTKASHAMAVIMRPAVLKQIMSDKTPCILQEYYNHDAFLYKVYVLGDHVSVHKRRSLPNLPHLNTQQRVIDYVEFDSQRPYPRLFDFGYNDKAEDDQYLFETKMEDPSENTVSVEEILPIVNALRDAFGLQLFGFDVLITSTDRRMLVIDVNYFPSYKEVTNFPALLAKYLTDRVLESRRKAIIGWC